MTDQSPAYHYQVIARALKIIDAAGPQLSLDDLAAQMGISVAHFQRTFSQWVGVSPKRYQQYLTLDHARRLLADRFTVLETALSTGLSGGGRLHDLFLTWDQRILDCGPELKRRLDLVVMRPEQYVEPMSN